MQKRYKALLSPLLALILITNLAYITNPTADNFAEYARAQLRQEAGITAETNKFAVWLFDKAARLGLDLVTDRKDYRLCSIYTLDLGQGGEVQYLGIFGSFVRLGR